MDDDRTKMNVNIVRCGDHMELVEVKRVYKHPNYYDYNAGVAVLELGRRIHFGFDKFADSPSCMDQGIDVTDKIATVRGFGTTDTGVLLETNVTVISNQKCKEIINQGRLFICSLNCPRSVFWWHSGIRHSGSEMLC